MIRGQVLEAMDRNSDGLKQDRITAFLSELAKLTKQHRIAIGPTGWMGVPGLQDVSDDGAEGYVYILGDPANNRELSWVPVVVEGEVANAQA